MVEGMSAKANRTRQKQVMRRESQGMLQGVFFLNVPESFCTKARAWKSISLRKCDDDGFQDVIENFIGTRWSDDVILLSFGDGNAAGSLETTPKAARSCGIRR